MVVLEAFKSPYIAKTNPRGLARALKLMEMEMQGHHHRGIDEPATSPGYLWQWVALSNLLGFALMQVRRELLQKEGR